MRHYLLAFAPIIRSTLFASLRSRPAALCSLAVPAKTRIRETSEKKELSHRSVPQMYVLHRFEMRKEPADRSKRGKYNKQTKLRLQRRSPYQPTVVVREAEYGGDNRKSATPQSRSILPDRETTRKHTPQKKTRARLSSGHLSRREHLCMVVCPDVLRKTSLCEPPRTTTTQTFPELNLPCALVCGQLLGSAQQILGKRHREPTHAKLNHCSKQQFQDLCLDRSAFLAFLAAPAAILVAVGCSKNVLRSRSDGQVRRETKRSRPPAKKERRTCACACRPL